MKSILKKSFFGFGSLTLFERGANYYYEKYNLEIPYYDPFKIITRVSRIILLSFQIAYLYNFKSLPKGINYK